jgi:hypothetical protein
MGPGEESLTMREKRRNRGEARIMKKSEPRISKNLLGIV